MPTDPFTKALDALEAEVRLRCAFPYGSQMEYEAARAALLAALIGGEGARSRAEGSDLSVDQGREFRVVDGLGDNNRAGKVTIDPTLLSPATPRSRAEAEAMVEAMVEAAHLKRNTIIRGGDFPAKTFVGDWVAIPREDFDALKSARAVLDRLAKEGA